MAANSIPGLFRSLSVSSFSSVDGLLEFERSTGCLDALVNMRAVGVTGAPVYSHVPADADAAEIVALHPRSIISSHRRYDGFVDVTDMAAMLLVRGLHRSTPHGLLAKLGAKLLPDDEHSVGAAINFSGLDTFHHVPSSANLAQVIFPPACDVQLLTVIVCGTCAP